MSNESYLDEASRLWNDAKRDYPKTALVASVLPITGQVTSALELNDAINRGDKTDMALAAAGLVPAAKLISTGVKAVRAGEAVQKVARNTLTGADIYSASKKAGQAMKNRGAATVAAGAGTEAASTGSNLSDYVDAWKQGEQ